MIRRLFNETVMVSPGYYVPFRTPSAVFVIPRTAHGRA